MPPKHPHLAPLCLLPPGSMPSAASQVPHSSSCVPCPGGCRRASWWLWLHPSPWCLGSPGRHAAWLASGTGRAELYLPFLVISGASTDHQNCGWKWPPPQKLLQGNNERSCGWTGIVSLESNLEMRGVHLGCLFILFFTVVLVSKHESRQHFDKEEKHIFLLCRRKWPSQEEWRSFTWTWACCVICGALTHLPGF